MLNSDNLCDGETRFLPLLGIKVNPDKVVNMKLRRAIKRMDTEISNNYTKHSEHVNHSRYSACGPMLFY